MACRRERERERRGGKKGPGPKETNRGQERRGEEGGAEAGRASCLGGAALPRETRRLQNRDRTPTPACVVLKTKSVWSHHHLFF